MKEQNEKNIEKELATNIIAEVEALLYLMTERNILRLQYVDEEEFYGFWKSMKAQFEAENVNWIEDERYGGMYAALYRLSADYSRYFKFCGEV